MSVCTVYFRQTISIRYLNPRCLIGNFEWKNKSVIWHCLSPCINQLCPVPRCSQQYELCSWRLLHVSGILHNTTVCWHSSAETTGSTVQQ